MIAFSHHRRTSTSEFNIQLQRSGVVDTACNGTRYWLARRGRLRPFLLGLTQSPNTHTDYRATLDSLSRYTQYRLPLEAERALAKTKQKKD